MRELHRWWANVAALVLLAAVATGCATTQARTVPAGPPLEVPPPPARVPAPVDVRAAPEVATVETPPDSGPEDALMAPREPPAPAPAAAPAPLPEAPLPPRDLRAASGAEEATALAEIRTTLRRAARDLQRVDYNRLSGPGRLQYEQSRRFGQQAEEAIRDRNLVFAATLAEKAATLAAELAGG